MGPKTLFLIVAFLVLLLGLYRLIFSKMSKSWPVVQGRVSERNNTINGGPNDALNQLKIKYEYSVKNKSYVSSRLCFGTLGFGSKQELFGALPELQQGSMIEIRYWPLFPSVSVYKPGFVDVRKNLALLFFGIVFVGVFW